MPLAIMAEPAIRIESLSKTYAGGKKALDAVLKTLSPATLTLPESILALLPPRPPGLPRTEESFPAHTGLTFDPIAAAESSADLTLSLLCNPERASRLIEYHMRLPQSPSLRSVLADMLAQNGVAGVDLRAERMEPRAPWLAVGVGVGALALFGWVLGSIRVFFP